MCYKSLIENATPSPSHVKTFWGLPFNFIFITEDGCFAARKTQVEWNALFLLMDVVVIGILAILPYAIPWLLEEPKDQED